MTNKSRLTFLKSTRFREALLLLTSQLPFFGVFQIAWCFGQGNLLPMLFVVVSKLRANFKVFKTKGYFRSCQNSELKLELSKVGAISRAVEFCTFSWGCQILGFFLRLSKHGVKLGAAKIHTFLRSCQRQSFFIGQLFTHTFLGAVKFGVFLLGSRLPTFFRELSKLRFFDGVTFYPCFSLGSQKSELNPNRSKRVAGKPCYYSLCGMGQKIA